MTDRIESRRDVQRDFDGWWLSFNIFVYVIENFEKCRLSRLTYFFQIWPVQCYNEILKCQQTLSTIKMAALVCSKINKSHHFVCTQNCSGPSRFKLVFLALIRPSPIFRLYFFEDLTFVQSAGWHLCIGYVCHVWHSARWSKNHLLLLELKHAKFSLHEKWNNYHHPYLTVSIK